MVIKTLTEEQWQRAYVLREHYFNRVTRTPREKWVSTRDAQQAIEDLCQSLGIPKKYVIITDGPMQAQILANILKTKKINDQLWHQLRDQLWRQLSDQLSDQLSGQLRDQLSGQRLEITPFEYVGNSNVGWLCLYDFLLRENIPFKNEHDRTQLESLMLKVQAVLDANIFNCLNFENAIIAWRNPKYVHYDNNLLHKSDGPSVEWYDGTKQYAWHGTRMPEWPFKNPKQLTALKIMQESNTEVRRAMAEMMGIGNFLLDLNPEVLHEESWCVPTSVDRNGKIEVVEHRYRLLRASFQDYPNLVMLEMTDPSTDAGYMEGVPPNTKRNCSAHQPNEDDWCPNCMEKMTCRAAEAWRQRTKLKDYKPEVIA